MGYRIIQTDETAVCRQYGVSALAGKMLAASGLPQERIEELLHGESDLRTSTAPCVKAACTRILAARDHHEKVFVGGDYDADGICSTAMMKDVLNRLGIVNGYYIPDRFREGYGLKPETVRLAHEKGYSLIITVDNGVKAHEAIAEAHRLGMDILVTDHHRIEEPVDTEILVHPDVMEEEYEYLCGAGVVLQIARTLVGDCAFHTALAAVAHIGDVMPLWKQTRVIVRRGMELLNQGAVKALDAMNTRREVYDREMLGFRIVPMLNAIGRMNDVSNVNTLVPFLLSRDEVQLASYAAQLSRVNEMRKQLSAQMVKDAEKMIGDDPFPVIASSSFHEGICGLAAGRLARMYSRPVLILAETAEGMKGSGRSVPGLDLYGFFREGFPELIAFGGHSMAVGLTVDRNSYGSFREKVHRRYEESGFTPAEETRDYILIDKHVALKDVMDLSVLEPLPEELSRYAFAMQEPAVISRSDLPKASKFLLENGSDTVDAVVFGYRQLQIPEEVHLIGGTLRINVFRGKRSIQLDADLIE